MLLLDSMDALGNFLVGFFRIVWVGGCGCVGIHLLYSTEYHTRSLFNCASAVTTTKCGSYPQLWSQYGCTQTSTTTINIVVEASMTIGLRIFSPSTHIIIVFTDYPRALLPYS